MRFVQRSTAAFALGLALCAAIRVSSLPTDLLFMLPAVAVAWAGVFSALRARRGSPRLFLWVAVPCWVWLLMLVVNPFWSAWTEMSIWIGLTFALLPASVLGLHELLGDDRVWNRLEWFVFGAAAFVAVWMLCEYFVLGQRADGPFLDPNVASAVVYASLLPLLYRFFVATDRGLLSYLLVGLVFVLSAGLFTSFSRGGVGSFVIALAGTAIVLLVAGGRAARWRFTGCLVVILVAYSVVYYGPQQPHVRTLTNLSQDHSLQMRFLMWDSALDIYADAPVLGSGLGTFDILYARYRSPVETGTTGDMAHNDYLQVLAESGPLGLALLLGFVLCVLSCAMWLMWRLWRSRMQPGVERRAMMRDMGLCATLLALCVHATVNFIFYPLLLALLAGLYAARLAGRYALTHRGAPGRRTWDVLRRLVRPVFAVAALISLVSIGTASVSFMTLHPGMNSGADYVSMDNPEYQLALTLSSINPLDYRALFYIARAEAVSATRLQKLGAEEQAASRAIQALSDFQRLLAVKRPDCSSQANKGTLLWHFRSQEQALRRAGVWQDPAQVLRRAIAAVPICMPAWIALAKLREGQDSVKLGIAVLEHAKKWMNFAPVERGSAAKMLVTLAQFVAQAGNRSRALKILRVVISAAPWYQPALSLRSELKGVDK